MPGVPTFLFYTGKYGTLRSTLRYLFERKALSIQIFIFKSLSVLYNFKLIFFIKTAVCIFVKGFFLHRKLRCFAIDHLWYSKKKWYYISLLCADKFMTFIHSGHFTISKRTSRLYPICHRIPHIRGFRTGRFCSYIWARRRFRNPYRGKTERICFK